MAEQIPLSILDFKHYQETGQNLHEVDNDRVHYYDKSSGLAQQARCGYFTIREEFEWTTTQVNCLECLATGPRP